MATRITLNPMQLFHDVPGKPSMSWSQWRREMEVYLLASGMAEKDEKVQMAVIKHSLGSEGQKTLFTIPGSNNIDAVEDLFQLLGNYYEPKHNIIAEWVKFVSMEQRQAESVNEFVTRLRHQATHCDFNDLTDRMLTIMLGAKAVNPKVRTLLLQQGNELSLEKATTIANSVETATTDARAIDKILNPYISKVNYVTAKPQRNHSKHGSKPFFLTNSCTANFLQTV